MLRRLCLKAIRADNLLSPRVVCATQNAGLKATYGEKYPYSEPFDYEKKPYDVWRSMFDKTKHRFNENTKVIVVEGNVGVGKAEFAKEIAKGFDLKYFAPVSDNKCFIEEVYGMDLRDLNALYPASCRFYDLNDFYDDPHPEKGTAARLAVAWYKEKFFKYAQALKHLMSTGQGVVLASSVYSDLVYVEALRALGWCSKDFMNFYKDLRDNSLCELFKPHLTIYLDAPISTIQQRISETKPEYKGKRNLSTKYLETLDLIFKNNYLPFARKHGEVVEIDWKEKANKIDMDTIIEEMQLLKLENEDLDDIKFHDWSRCDDSDLLDLRQMLDTRENMYWLLDRVPCEELVPTADEKVFIDRINTEHPVLQGIPPGFATELGNRPLFK